MAIAPESDLRDIQDFLMRLLAEQRESEAVQMVLELLRTLRRENTQLQLRLHKALRQQYGRRSEGISSEQLSLFMRQLEDSGQPIPKDLATFDLDEDDDLDAISDAEESVVEVKSYSRRGSRRPIPAEVRRVEHVCRVEGEDRICPECGKEKTPFGHEVSKVLNFVPAHFVLDIYLKEKVACRPCGEHVSTAAGPTKVIEGGIPGAGLLANVVVEKYRDGLPLYRQVGRFKRIGMDFSRSTLVGWVAHAARILEPVANALQVQAMGAFVLHTDATGLPVLDNSHPNNIKRGSLLCHVGDNGVVFFKYVPDQSKEGPQEILKDREGYVCADAAGVYDGVFADPTSLAIEIACWMHARRYYERALDAGDLRAAIPMKYIKRLYKIEKLAKRRGYDAERRGRLRREKSQPVLDSLHAWVAGMYEVEPPGTGMHKALTYSINQWQALNRYIEDGRLPIDNGPAERAITTVAVGRKNYLFAGSDAGGERAAILYSVLASCALADVEPWAYLSDVLQKIAEGWSASRIGELLPAAWKAARSPPAEAAA